MIHKQAWFLHRDQSGISARLSPHVNYSTDLADHPITSHREH
jgi:hypothetical protein